LVFRIIIIWIFTYWIVKAGNKVPLSKCSLWLTTAWSFVSLGYSELFPSPPYTRTKYTMIAWLKRKRKIFLKKKTYIYGWVLYYCYRQCVVCHPSTVLKPPFIFLNPIKISRSIKSDCCPKIMITNHNVMAGLHWSNVSSRSSIIISLYCALMVPYKPLDPADSVITF